VGSRVETVVLRLEDQISRGADAATGALGRLEAKIVREQAQLLKLEEGLSTAQKKLQGISSGNANGFVNISEYRRAGKEVESLANKILSQKDRIASLRDGLGEKEASAADTAKRSLLELASASRILGGEQGRTASRISSFAASLVGIAPNVAAVAIAVIAATVAISAYVIAISSAIKISDEYRTKILDLASAGVTLYNSQRSSIASAEALNDAISRVSATSATARDKISEYAVDLKNSLFFGRQLFSPAELEKTLGIAALVNAGGNDRLAKQYIESARAAKMYGRNLDALNERMRLKFSFVAEKRLLALDVQIAKFKEGLTFIFSGTDVEPLLRGLHAVLSIFSANTESAQGMRRAVTSMTEAAIGGILDLSIALVKGYIWLRKHETIWNGIKLIAKSAVLGILVVVSALSIALAAIIVPIGAVVTAVSAAIGGIASVVHDAIHDIGNFSVGDLIDKAADLGSQIAVGIARGLRDGAHFVVSAIHGLADRVIKSAEDFLGIHSPSRRANLRIGRPVAQGAAEGVLDSSHVFTRAVRQMSEEGTSSPVLAQKQSTREARPPAPAPSASSTSVSFANCTFGENSEESIRLAIFTALEEASVMR